PGRARGAGVNIVFAPNLADWRAWLARCSEIEQQAWLVIYHKNSATPSVRYGEAVEQALCFGWIDSLAHKHDADSFRLRFTPRRESSRWSAVNRQRAARMIEQGLMTERGRRLFDANQLVGAGQSVRADNTFGPGAGGANEKLLG